MGLGDPLVPLVLDAAVPGYSGTHRTDSILKGEVVGLVAGQRLMPAALAQLGLVGDQTLQQVALLVVPLRLGLGDNLDGLAQPAGVTVGVEASLDGAGLPAVEPLRADPEFSGEAEASHFRRPADKTFRH